MTVTELGTAPKVQAVYPSLRLFPDSIRALTLDDRATGAMAHFSDKERIDVTVDNDLTEAPLPIEAIFVLGDATDDGQIALRRLTVSQTCIAVLESSFSLDPSDTAEARRRLVQASDLARAVPAFHISYPRDYAQLPEVRRAILDQVAALEVA